MCGAPLDIHSQYQGTPVLLQKEQLFILLDRTSHEQNWKSSLPILTLWTDYATNDRLALNLLMGEDTSEFYY